MRWLRSSERATDGAKEVALLGRLVSMAGVASIAAGVATWLAIRLQLAAEKVVIPESAPWFAGRPVRGPMTALAEAEAIRRIALESTGGRTYGELDEDDPLATMAMNASLLRASLFTSILAFGMAAAEVAAGAILVAIGTALRGAGHRLSS